ncbi:hypothetical protein [Methanobrevibacter curvatus]|uniref:hypothetical protein n=1 Tax=Methanobrevibacter curvatus TaxID=49547 RepID=UPI001471E1A9|nr:hypothetical protein [Methanobrevibacter curvatus]
MPKINIGKIVTESYSETIKPRTIIPIATNEVSNIKSFSLVIIINLFTNSQYLFIKFYLL